MKKLLVLVLAISMILAFATSAFAADTLVDGFSDLEDQATTHQDAAYLLKALGVIEGYGDNTVHPDANITRAEFAKIVCFLGGEDETFAYAKNTVSKFSDVPVTAWFNGWVNIAADNGWVVGYTNGTFQPNAPISMQEAWTVIARILGYDNAHIGGTWPNNYNALVGKEGVAKHINYVGSAPATRADLFTVVGEALFCTTVSWNSFLNGFVDYDFTETFRDDKEYNSILLDKNFGAYYAHVEFDNGYGYNSTWRTSQSTELSAWEYEDFEDGQIIVKARNWFNNAEEELLGETVPSNGDSDLYAWYYGDDEFELADEYYIGGGYALTDLGGQRGYIFGKDLDDKGKHVGERGHEQGGVAYIRVCSSVSYSDDVDIVRDNALVGDGTGGYSESFYDDEYAIYAEEINGKDTKFGKYENYAIRAYNFGAVGTSLDAKVMTSERGNVYAVYGFDEEYGSGAGSITGPDYYGIIPEVGVVKKITSSEITFVTENNAHKVSLKDDVAAFKDGDFIKVEDIVVGDVVWVFNDTNGKGTTPNGFDVFLMVRPQIEADLIKGKNPGRDTAGSITLGDVSLKWDDKNNINGLNDAKNEGLMVYSWVSSDKGETYAALTENVYETMVDSDAFTTSGTYTLGYNPYRLGVLTGEWKASTKLVGVITDYELNKPKFGNSSAVKLESIDILLADGTEATYEMASKWDFELNADDILDSKVVDQNVRVDRSKTLDSQLPSELVAMANNGNLGGAMVQIRVNKDDEIIAAMIFDLYAVNQSTFNASTDFKDYENFIREDDGNDFATLEIVNNRYLRWYDDPDIDDGSMQLFSFTSDAAIFSVEGSLKDGDLEVSVDKASSVLKNHDSITATYFLKENDGVKAPIEYLLVKEGDLGQSEIHIGLVVYTYAGGPSANNDYFVIFDTMTGKEYIANDKSFQLLEGYVVAFTVNSKGEAVLESAFDKDAPVDDYTMLMDFDFEDDDWDDEVWGQLGRYDDAHDWDAIGYLCGIDDYSADSIDADKKNGLIDGHIVDEDTVVYVPKAMASTDEKDNEAGYALGTVEMLMEEALNSSRDHEIVLFVKEDSKGDTYIAFAFLIKHDADFH